MKTGKGNTFEKIAQVFGSHSENFFTATYGYMLGVFPDLRDALLRVLEAKASESLLADDWEDPEVQVRRDAGEHGTAILDIVLRSKSRPLEIWMECKLDAPQGVAPWRENGERVPQMERYNYAARLWCEDEKNPRQVLLIYIAKRLENASAFAVLQPHTKGSWGYICPKDRPHFRWRDLYPTAAEVLESHASSKAISRESVLASEFKTYWDNLPGMRPVEIEKSWGPGERWSGLRDPQRILSYKEQWLGVRNILRNEWGDEPGDDTNGAGLYISPQERGLRQVHVRKAHIDKVPKWGPSLPKEVIEVAFDFDEGWEVPNLPEPDRIIWDGGRPFIVCRKRGKPNEWHWHVGVLGWKNCETFEQQQRALEEAVEFVISKCRGRTNQSEQPIY